MTHRHEELRLLRGVLLADGAAVCCFRRRVHETLTVVLERSGHAFTLVRADGSQTRHLTPTSRSGDRALVLAALALRNRCLWHCDAADASPLPYVHCALWSPGAAEPLVRRPRRQRSDRSNELHARWPTGTLSAAKLFDPATQRFEVCSIEGNARVRLHPSGRLAEALYAVRAKSSVAGEGGDDEDSHEYVATVRQTFSTRRTPPCFAYAVALLQHAREALDANETEFDASGGGACSQPLPGNAAFGARPTFAALAPTGREDALALEDVLRVASRPTRKVYARVAAELTEDATFFVCREDDGGPATVLIELAAQAAVVECTGGFFRWFDDRGRLLQQFTTETIPPTTFFPPPTASSPSVRALCTHAMELLRSQGGPTASAAASSPPGSDDDASSDVVEAVETEHGRFRAFADGRVRAVFQDRTILQVDRERVRCAFFFADGSAGQTTVAAAPPAQQRYVHRALEFADWAFASPRERMLRHEQRQLHARVASQELHRISVRFGMNDLVAPGAAAASPSSHHEHTHDGRASDVPHYLTPPAVRQLQEATQRHIASVESLLRR